MKDSNLAQPALGRLGIWEVRKVRFLSLLVFISAALWLGDLFFFKGRYANELRVTVERMSHNVRYEITRWVP